MRPTASIRTTCVCLFLPVDCSLVTKQALPALALAVAVPQTGN
ncbi:MAG TPA: hypothetical protein VM184_01215 [Gaiellaceae bacterium]|nr:hypothetical protein [Gaiellaceae bacterium]